MKILFFSLVGLFVLIWVAWRLLSNRAALPCPSWLAWMVEMDNPFTKVNRVQNIVQSLNLQPDMRVLDVGCGPGRVSVPLAKAVGPSGQVVALDVQENMLQRAKEKARKAGAHNIQFMQGDVCQQNLPAASFDVVLLVTVLGEIPDRAAALSAIYRSLKLGGVLSVTEIIFDPHFQRQATVLKLALPAGFRKKALFGNGIAYTMHLEK